MTGPAHEGFVVRPARPADADAWLDLRTALWPDPEGAHRAEIERYFAGDRRNPAEVFLAVNAQTRVLGMAELSIRSVAEGCLTDRVAFLEGWYVAPDARRRGVGRALVAAAAEWGRARGCTEFASDAEADNDPGARAHRALGFEEVGLLRCFVKRLARG